MESRLSEESVKSKLDAGHQSLLWEPGQPSGFLAGIDFDVILSSPDAKKIIQAMPTQPLYYALKQRGLAESGDILPLLSQEQVVRIMDYDVWRRDRLIVKQAFALMQHFAEVSREELYRRFAYLDEEYQLTLLGGYFHVYEEEDFEKLADEAQDSLYAMPCNTVYYEILTEDKDERAFLEELMEALKEHNLRYAYSLLGHAAFAPPNEQEALIQQFRRARLEEDGFVSYEDSQEIFTPIDRQLLLEKWADVRAKARKGALSNPIADEADFLGQVLRQALVDGWDIDEQFAIHQSLLHLANAMCSAAQVEPDDLYGLNRVLEQCKAIVGLGLDFLAQSDVELALDIIKAEHPKVLFRVGLSLFEDLRAATIRQLKRLSLASAENLERLYLSRQWGSLIYTLDRHTADILGFENTEIFKGLFNRFPMAPKTSSVDDGRVSFQPVGSLSVFRQLQLKIWGILGTLEIAELSSFVPLVKSLDKVLITATVQAILSGQFKAEALSLEKQEEFLSLDKSAMNGLIDELLSSLSDQLKGRVDYWAQGIDSARTDWALDSAKRHFEQAIDGLILAKANNNPIGPLVLS